MWNRGGPPQLTAHLRRLMPVINPIVFASRPTILRNAKNLCCMGKRHSGRSRARVCAREDLKEAAELADLLTDQDATGAIKVLRAGLKATKKFWDANTREWVEQPDRKVQHESAMAILAYAYGKPIERQMVATGKFEDLAEIVSGISASPMAMKKLGHLLPEGATPNLADSSQTSPKIVSEIPDRRESD